jgi:PqqD family protein of HPr-rel-A system
VSAAAAGAPERWALIDPDSVETAHWDDETVLYDDREGSTHVVSAAAGRVVAALATAGAPVPRETLAGALAGPDGAAPEPDLLDTVLEELMRIGVVRTAPP